MHSSNCVSRLKQAAMLLDKSHAEHLKLVWAVIKLVSMTQAGSHATGEFSSRTPWRWWKPAEGSRAWSRPAAQSSFARGLWLRDSWPRETCHRFGYRAVLQSSIYLSFWDIQQSCNQSSTSPFGTQRSPATKRLSQLLGQMAVVQPVSYVTVWDAGQSCNQAPTSAFGTEGTYVTRQPRPGLGRGAVLQPSTYVSFWDTGQLCNQAPTSAFGTQGSYASSQLRQRLGHRAVMQPSTHVSLWDTGQSCNHTVSYITVFFIFSVLLCHLLFVV